MKLIWISKWWLSEEQYDTLPHDFDDVIHVKQEMPIDGDLALALINAILAKYPEDDYAVGGDFKANVAARLVRHTLRPIYLPVEDKEEKHSHWEHY